MQLRAEKRRRKRLFSSFLLESAAFKRYFEDFVRDGALKEETKDYSTVTGKLIEEFGRTPKPEIQKAINAKLDLKNLMGSLAHLDPLDKRVRFIDTSFIRLASENRGR